MAAWVISQIKARLNAIMQMVIIAIMNCLEFMLTPHLLLWGRANIIFASLFIFVIYYNQFILIQKPASQI
jgi:hypothetical protein